MHTIQISYDYINPNTYRKQTVAIQFRTKILYLNISVASIIESFESFFPSIFLNRHIKLQSSQFVTQTNASLIP